jgi:hypothetical protein
MQDITITTGRPPEDRAHQAGTRVLFLPKNSRTEYFQSFLKFARERESWDIRVVCAESSQKLWNDVVSDSASFSSIPDFSVEQPWEHDADAVARVDAMIGECERATGISASRIILSGERDIGRGFSKATYYWFHNKIARMALADTSEPQRIVRRMFVFAREVLSATQPKFMIGGEWADPLCFTFYLTAQQMGIPCFVNRFSKVLSGRCFWSSEMLMYNDLGRASLAQKRAAGAPVSEQAREHFANFRSKPRMVGYMRAIWDKMDRTTWWRRHEEIARIFAVNLRGRLRGYRGPQPKPALRLLWDYYRRGWLEWRNARFFRTFDEETLERTRYIYLPMHKDPEQALNYQAPFWVDQIATVGLASSSLPAGYKLLVREHRTNPARRPARFYKQLAMIPGVVLVDGYDSQFKYLRHADLIFTDNGASAWEGMMLHKRVLTLADSFFDGEDELFRRVRQPEGTGAVVIELLDKPAVADPEKYDRVLGWYFDAQWETSAPVDEEGHARGLEILGELRARIAAKPSQSSVTA